MSKAICLKLKEEIFKETDQIAKKNQIPRNAYINKALAFYNKIHKRNLLKNQLQKEAQLAKESSLEVMQEFNQLEGEILE
jgi:predicted transcriptional regulator